jgi:hypothetical protein
MIRIQQLALKGKINRYTHKQIYAKYGGTCEFPNEPKETKYEEICKILLHLSLDNGVDELSSIMEGIDKKFNQENPPEEKTEYALNLIEQLIVESIFCHKEIIRLSKTMGKSYLFNNQFLAYHYDHLADWMRIYAAYKNVKEYSLREKGLDNKNTEKRITKWTGESDAEKVQENKNRLNTLFKKSNSLIDRYLQYYYGESWERESMNGYYVDSENALLHYYESKGTHNGGKSYHNLIENMYYLQDDFNDRSIHFNIALERVAVNSRHMEARLEELKTRNKKSHLHDPKRYFTFAES